MATQMIEGVGVTLDVKEIGEDHAVTAVVGGRKFPTILTVGDKLTCLATMDAIRHMIDTINLDLATERQKSPPPTMPVVVTEYYSPSKSEPGTYRIVRVESRNDEQVVTCSCPFGVNQLPNGWKFGEGTKFCRHIEEAWSSFSFRNRYFNG